MERLEILDLELNSLSGTIPIQIGQIFSLRLIVLSFNFLSGQLPWEIGNLENLLVLLITDSLISGTLPHQLFNCSNLYDLDLSRNHIHGIIPDTLTGLKHLSNCSDNAIINCSEYQYVPNVACNVTYYDAVSKVSFFSISLNHLSGSIPNSLTELTCLSYIDLSRNLLTGTFSNEIGNIQVLSSLILSFNSISGTIPASIASITELQELTLNNNKFVGHLPSNWSSSHRLNVLSVEDNSLSGPIPQQIGNLRKLESLAMFSNLLTGTVPSSLGRLENLLALILSSNRLHGPLTFINSSSPKLQAIDISSNKFTGQIPISLFKLPKIASISLIKNCFHGTIPEEICTFGHTLTSLGLNGLSTGDACKIPILPILHSYTANFMEGTVPTCLFSMPNLQRLQLAGNGLSGTLPNLDLISPHLEDIYIAFNRLSGTIPSCFSQASLLNFDASNNQLTGTAHGVSRYFDTNRATRGSMSLKQNRLSGPIPLSFKNAKNIDILRGNLFGCSSRHELPPNDPANATSGCGTNFINLILIVSVSLLVALSVLLIFIWQYSRTKFILGHFLEFFWDTCTKSTSRSSEKNDVELTEWRDVDKDLENSTSIRSLNNVETFYLFDMFPEIREFSKELLFVTLVLFLPLCLGLKLSEQNYTTHAQQYGLTPSIAFLTGAGSAISVFLLVVFVAFFIERRLSYFSVKTFKQFECRDSVRYSIETLSNFVTKAYSRTSFFSEQPFFDRIFCLNLLFCVFDIAFISAVNGAFVYAILTQTQDIVLLSEMCLAVVKLVWSMIVLPEVLGYINMKDTSIINGRRSTCLDLQVWLSIFNIVVSPLLAMMVDGDNCFLAAFTSSSPIESKQVYNTCKVQSITGVCKDAHRIIRTQFEPPFMYSYQCSSGLILNYVAVYIMLYTFLIAVSWTTHMYLAFVVITYPGDEVSYRERFLKCLQPESQKNAVKSRSPISSKQGAVLKSIDIPIFNYLARKSARADKYICKVVVDLVIICTFGFAYPPLGVLVVVSLCLGTLEWSLLFCRCSDVYEKNEKCRVLKYPQMRCGGAIDLLTRNRWVIITIFCWFYCVFLIDITEKCVHLKLLPWLLFVFPIGMFLTQAVLASVKEPPPRISTAASSLDLASNSDFSGSSNRSNTSEPICYTESPLSLGASRGGLAPNIILDAEVVAPGLSVGDESIRYTESPLRDVSRHE